MRSLMERVTQTLWANICIFWSSHFLPRPFSFLAFSGLKAATQIKDSIEARYAEGTSLVGTKYEALILVFLLNCSRG